MKTFKNIVPPGYNGKPIPVNVTPEKLENLTITMAMRAILNNAPFKTINDSVQGGRLMLALDKAEEEKGDIVIEEGTHDWFKPLAEQICPPLFKINGNLIYEHIKEGFEKSAQPDKKR